MAPLNVDLIFKQNVTPERIARLHWLHAEKDKIFKEAKILEDTNVRGVPRMLVARLCLIEYAMQHAWGFPLNPKRHTWKYLMPNTPFQLKRGSWASRYLGNG